MPPSRLGQTTIDLRYSSVVLAITNIIDLTPQELRPAASIREQIDGLNKELRQLLDGSISNGTTSTKKRTMSAAARRKIAAARRARWAKRRGGSR
jgi:hypothetical protein